MALPEGLERIGEIWSARSVRLTVFPISDSQADFGWRNLTGEEPEQIQDKPRALTRLEEGTFTVGQVEAKMSVQVTPVKVDLVISADPVPDDLGPAHFRTLPLSPAFSALRNLATRWFDQGLAVNRMAFGAVLWRAASSKPEAYSWLEELLPVSNLSGETSDFIYQINRRRPSLSAEGVAINRLSNWTAQRQRFMVMSVNGPENVESVPAASAESTGLQLVMDINNVLVGPALPPDSLPDLFDEFMALGTEIAERGDLP